MSTECYAMVRGSVVRVTALDRCGGFDSSKIRYATSRSTAKVVINEVTESSSNEVLRTDEDEPRLHFVKSAQTLRHELDIDFLRVDPGVLSLITGVPVVFNAAGDIVGFDANTKIVATAFALEVWSRLAEGSCAEGRRWGYTLFPFVKGGILSGFSFSNGLVAFNIRKARTHRSDRWGIGPHDLTGLHQRLTEPVSRNTSWRTFSTLGVPPEQQDGIIEFEDVIEGGSASATSADILDGEFVVTSPETVDGGRA